MRTFCHSEGRRPRRRSAKKKAGSKTPPPNSIPANPELALRELEAAAGLRLAVFLALDGTAVAREEAAFLQHGAQAGFVIGQRLRNSVTNSTCLAGKAAADDGRDDVELAVPVS